MAFAKQEDLAELTAQFRMELEKQAAKIDSMSAATKSAVDALAANTLPEGWRAEVERCIQNESSKTEHTSQTLQRTCDLVDQALKELQDRTTALEQKSCKGYTGKGGSRG